MCNSVSCSYALFDKAGNQVPQELVTKVGENFEHILEEVCTWCPVSFFFCFIDVACL